MVSQRGVFVIDAKNYQGRIEVRGGWGASPSLWVAGRRGTKLVDAVERQAAAVQRLLDPATVPVPVQPVLVFVHESWTASSRCRSLGRVHLAGLRSLPTTLSGPAVLSLDAVSGATCQLERGLRTAV